MALRFVDSFDHYATADVLLKWSANTGSAIGSSAGRFGNGMSVNNTGLTKALDLQSTWIIGFAFKPSALPGSDVAILKVMEGATVHVDLRLTASGVLRATLNGTSLGLGTIVLSTATHQYIEIKVTISDTVGVAVVKVNGVTDINVSGADTRNGGSTSQADSIRFGVSGLTGNYDDVYICDGTGSSPTNDFLGDCRVEAIFPSGAGNSAQWTPSAGSNYQNVDEASQNADTDYNSSSTANQIDSFAYGNITPSSATIYGIQYNLIARKDDAGARTIAPLSRHSSTDYASATTHALSTSYVDYTQIKEQNPGTSAAWTVSDVNGDEFGYKEIA